MNDKEIKTLIVAGRFDDDGGRASGYIDKLFSNIPRSFLCEYINGGSWSEIESLTHKFKEFDVIIWIPDIPNDKVKIVNSIKKINTHCLLVISKNNFNSKYPLLALIARSLKVKSNLFIEFTKQQDKILGSLYDPLGNVFILETEDTYELSQALFDRIKVLTTMTRVPSVRVGDAKNVPDQSEFFNIVRDIAEQFHTLIHAANQDRFVGNLSFRCERGFPSFRSKDLIFVSRRNIDKRHINKDGFVAVNSKSLDRVEYYGDHKPSVDTPIQLRLFDYYRNVHYMVHSHVYVKDAPFTKSIITCGSIEEFAEIVKIIDDSNTTNFAINLRGHGSIVFASSPANINKFSFEARKLPEMLEIE